MFFRFFESSGAKVALTVGAAGLLGCAIKSARARIPNKAEIKNINPTIVPDQHICAHYLPNSVYIGKNTLHII